MGARKKLALEQFHRDNILTAARELFETKGVSETTMDDIALQADYSKSTIYVYFRSKEDIYNSIVVDYLDVLIGELSAGIESEDDFRKCYFRLCERLTDFAAQYPRYYTSLMFGERAANSRKSGADILSGAWQELYGLVESLIAKGRKSGELPEKVDAKQTVPYLLSALGGIVWTSEKKKAEIERNTGKTLEEYRDFAFGTLYQSLLDGTPITGGYK